MREGGRDSALIGAPVNPYKYGIALAKAGIELGENESIYPKAEGETSLAE